MTKWLLWVRSFGFPRYKELAEKLKEIPDVLVMTSSFSEVPIEFYPLFKASNDVDVDINYFYGYLTGLLSAPYSVSYLHNKQKVVAHLFVTRQTFETKIKDKSEIIPTIVSYVSTILTLLSQNFKYLKETRKIVKEDLDKIELNDMDIRYETRIAIQQQWMDVFGCKIVEFYYYTLLYSYPYTVRYLEGNIFCCSDRCFMTITNVNYVDFQVNKIFVINLNGNKPTKTVIWDYIRTNKRMLKDIEEYVASSSP